MDGRYVRAEETNGPLRSEKEKKEIFLFLVSRIGFGGNRRTILGYVRGRPWRDSKPERLAVVGLLSLILLSWTRLERVSHLRSSGIYYFFCYPAPTHWANVCRTSGAWEKQERIARVSNPTSLQ